MPDPFVQALPGLGDSPWNLNPAIEEIRERFSSVATLSGGMLDPAQVPRNLRARDYFGIGAGVGSARNPYYANILLDGRFIENDLAAGGGDDYVGYQSNLTIQGGFEDLKTHLVGSITAGSTTLDLASGTFELPVKVGYTVVVSGAGEGGADLKAKITAITSTTRATLSVAAGTTVTAKPIIATLAADHAFVFAANDFFRTGRAVGDLAGIENAFGRLMELHLETPGAVLDTVKATSSELAIEASAVGSTLKKAIGHHVKPIVNHAGAAIESVIGLFVDGPTATGSAETWTLYAKGRRSWISGATRIGGEGAAGEVPLTVQRPLGATGPVLEVRDFTLTNRLLQINSGGGLGSASAVTAFEGLGAQTTIGSVSGGFAGIRFGSSGVEIRQSATGVAQVFNGKAFGVPAVTSANRAAATTAGAGALCLDTTLGKLIVSDGTVWRDMTGVTV